MSPEQLQAGAVEMLSTAGAYVHDWERATDTYPGPAGLLVHQALAVLRGEAGKPTGYSREEMAEHRAAQVRAVAERDRTARAGEAERERLRDELRAARGEAEKLRGTLALYGIKETA